MTTRTAIRTKAPRIVLVTRPTEYAELLARHGTREQARFFLATRGQALQEVEARHQRFERALDQLLRAVPTRWRRSRIERRDLDRFLFDPDDVVVALGQDGLVANLAKYLRGQVVVGINPDPDHFEGILVPHRPEAAAELLRAAASGTAPLEERTMVEAVLDEGPRLLALNEIFVGHRSHQSARYRIGWTDVEERQSSSGIVVTTGTGASGWARSIHRERRRAVDLPGPREPSLVFFVREAWPSVATGVRLTQGVIDQAGALELVSEMNDGGVAFGDGIEDDRLEFAFGRRLTVRVADLRLRLLAGT